MDFSEQGSTTGRVFSGFRAQSFDFRITDRMETRMKTRIDTRMKTRMKTRIDTRMKTQNFSEFLFRNSSGFRA